MTLKFSKRRCIIFITFLAGLFILSSTYKDKLFEMSHDVTQNEQNRLGKDSTTVKFFENLSYLTYDINYDLLILILSPFLSRERFWY